MTPRQADEKIRGLEVAAKAKLAAILRLPLEERRMEFARWNAELDVASGEIVDAAIVDAAIAHARRCCK